MNVDLSAVDWRKSRHSGGESGDCVEIGLVTSRDS
jgi:hypothetical protein